MKDIFLSFYYQRGLTMNYTLIILCLSLVACESSVVRREDYIANHPEWMPSTNDMIRQGYLLKGMTKEQVIAAWGKPCSSCNGTVTREWGETWEYATQIVYFDNSGTLIRWTAK